MEFISSFFIFLYGLIIGSFLNVVIFRLESEESIAVSRSHCLNCRHNLGFFDLIPVLSFLTLGGKCRYCGKPISWQYPLVEIATASLFLLIFNFQFSIFNEFSITNFQIVSLNFYFLLSTFYFLFIISSLIVIFVYDFKHYIIPDKLVFALIIAAFAYHLFSALNFGNWNLFEIWRLEFGAYILSAFAASGFFLFLVVLSRGKGMGMGDVKLAFALGLILGWPIVAFSLFVSFILGSLIGMILVVFKKKNFKSEIPFGPFLVFGAIIGLFWGQEIIEWYERYLF